MVLEFFKILNRITLKAHSLVEESALLEWERLEGLAVMTRNHGWVFWTLWDACIIFIIISVRALPFIFTFMFSGGGLPLVSFVILAGCSRLLLFLVVRIISSVVGVVTASTIRILVLSTAG